MKTQLAKLLTDAVATLQADGTLPADISPDVMIERTRDRTHGDYASNLALLLAKPARSKSNRLAHIKEKTAPLPDAAARSNEIPVV